MPDDKNLDNQDSSTFSKGEMHHVSIKPPAFCKERPELYFIQMESQFAIAKVTRDETKYHHVIGSLDAQVLMQVADIVCKPPDVDKYETVKNALITEYTDSDQKKLRKLVKEVELGDLRPTQLLKRMKELSNNKLPDDVLKSFWLERLPEQVRAVISIGSGDSMDMAKQADQMMDMLSFSNVSAIKNESPLEKKIDELQKQVEELRMSRNQARVNKNDSRERKRVGSKSRPRFPFCKYHWRFGSNAKKCVDPCQFKKLDMNSEN
ncbi:uncharacterized protein LOC129911073 [Episyrphus balteatus]|uniref:uncharacterized protein LOC129911073 n=1 Tax=Episyrphus balteatus TaxID=286459 RepID=UPI002484F4B2|nr:uncharacterized protein LOC129911073 [Episyrphus balteatus]